MTIKRADALTILWSWHQPPPLYLFGFRHALKSAWKEQFGCQCQVCNGQMDFKKHNAKNFATIDHIRSRLDPRRSEPANGEVRHVLACFECNQKRARFEMTEEYADEFRRRSNSDESLLHLPYPERSRRLKILAKRIEDSGLSGLVSVMGVPARWEMGRLPVKAGI